MPNTAARANVPAYLTDPDVLRALLAQADFASLEALHDALLAAEAAMENVFNQPRTAGPVGEAIHASMEHLSAVAGVVYDAAYHRIPETFAEVEERGQIVLKHHLNAGVDWWELAASAIGILSAQHNANSR